MPTLCITHPSSFEHVNPPGHPERTDRLKAINAVLEEERFKPLPRAEAPSVSLETVALCHPMEYIEEILEARYKAAGFTILEKGELPGSEWGNLKTSWAKRLKGNAERSVVYIIAQAT